MGSNEHIAIDRWLRHLKRYLKVARAGIDPEGIHQVRVATRRLDVWLRMGGWRIYRADLRWLRRVASSVRDYDVIIGRKGLPRGLRGQLMGRKRAFQAEFGAACETPRLSGMVAGLGVLPPITAASVEKRLGRFHGNVMEYGRVIEGEEASIEDFHRLRRACRRLRYGLELLGRPTTSLKGIQEALGRINDVAVEIRCLDGLDADEATTAYKGKRQADLEALLPDARTSWMSQRETLRDLLG